MDSLLFLCRIRWRKAAFEAARKLCGLFLLVCIGALSFPDNSYSQGIKLDSSLLIAKVPVTNAVLLSADRRGFFYVADEVGNLQQYNSKGEKTLFYSPAKQIKPNSIDSWNGLSILVFSRAYQQYTLLDRFLTEQSSNSVPNSDQGFASMLAVSLDNNIWVLDGTNFSVNKYQLNSNQLLFSNPLDLKLHRRIKEPVVFTEYQNYLYLSDTTGSVYLFDNTGSFFQELGSSKKPVAFANDYLIKVMDSSLVFDPLPRNLSKIGISYSFKEAKNIVRMAFTNEQLAILLPNELRIYRLLLP